MPCLAERVNITGTITATLCDILTGEVEVKVFKNLITSQGINDICRLLAGDSDGSFDPTKWVTYVAIGTGTTTPTSGDTQLAMEVLRKPVTAKDPVGPSAVFELYLLPSEGNVNIKEVGMFGQSATGVTNSGRMVERGLVDINKTPLKTLSIEIEIGVANGT